MSNPTLADWLDALERRSPESRIDLGLDRVREVRQRLDIDLSARPVITIGGTNGKGSVAAILEAMLLAAGHRPFIYTSPHLIEFGERMRIGGQVADAAAMVDAFDAVEQARDTTPLTYFEHITLSALVLCSRSDADVLVLEVGLGGRLDAVNIVDADVAIITSIDIDHSEWLGHTRGEIAREKAAIARPGRPVIVGDPNPPPELAESLSNLGAKLVLAQRDFSWRSGPERWTLCSIHGQIELPRPLLRGDWQLANAACAILALRELGQFPGLTQRAMATGLTCVRLDGRCQRIRNAPEVIVDVAHNAASARELAGALGRHEHRSLAVFSALAGKDIAAIAKALDGCFSHWLVAGLDGDRGRGGEEIAAELEQASVSGRLETVESVPAALNLALERAGTEDRIVVFGSFRTVAEAWPTLMQYR